GNNGVQPVSAERLEDRLRGERAAAFGECDQVVDENSHRFRREGLDERRDQFVLVARAEHPQRLVIDVYDLYHPGGLPHELGVISKMAAEVAPALRPQLVERRIE